MQWHTTEPLSSLHMGRIPPRDSDIRASLAGDPVLWAESSRELLRTSKAPGDREVKRIWTDWLDERDDQAGPPGLAEATSASSPSRRLPWRHYTERPLGSMGSGSIFFGDSGISPATVPLPERASTFRRPDEAVPLLEQAERELEEAERTFMASAASSIAAAHAADTGTTEERTIERIRSSAPSIIHRARALRRDLREFVNRIPGQPADPSTTIALPASESGTHRRRRSISPGEFDEMTERILRDARRRRLDGTRTAAIGSIGDPEPVIQAAHGTVFPRAAAEMVGR